MAYQVGNDDVHSLFSQDVTRWPINRASTNEQQYANFVPVFSCTLYLHLHPCHYFHVVTFYLYPLSFILYPLSFILYPLSFILYPSSFILILILILIFVFLIFVCLVSCSLHVACVGACFFFLSLCVLGLHSVKCRVIRHRIAYFDMGFWCSKIKFR